MARLHRTIARVIPLVLLAALAAIARSAPATTTESTPVESTPVAGQLLVASPEMGDPRFEHTVILLIHHDSHGAIGLAINRPIEEVPLASLMKSIGQDTKGVEGKVRLFAGGPVEPGAGFVLHSRDYHQAKTVDLGRFAAMTSTPQVFRDIAHKKGPHKFLIAFGYCGWGPGQLENELAQHAWFIAMGDPKLIFDEDRDKVWDEAMAERLHPL